MSDNNKPWLTPEGKSIWKTEAQYWSWLRGALRRLWSDYPLRKEWKKRQLRPVTPEERAAKLFHPSTKNVGKCVYCGEWFPGSKLECDHKVESDGCTSKGTAESFLWHCGGVVGDDLHLACQKCHKIQNHRQRTGLSFLEAKADKMAIDVQKQKIDKEVLSSAGVTPASNAKGRRAQLKELFMREG